LENRVIHQPRINLLWILAITKEEDEFILKIIATGPIQVENSFYPKRIAIQQNQVEESISMVLNQLSEVAKKEAS
jgi:hypothetical protein